jgi:diketogulonate reductase-like aldo/keto reductase
MTFSTSQAPTVALRDGEQIPQLGFGVFQVPPAETEAAVTRALEVGYRHIDTAAAYRNEAGVARAIAAAGVDRSEVFITTKLFNDDHGGEKAQRAFAASLERLETDYVDLYLIHWPVPSEDRYVETWQALEEFHREGRARSIGVSNFNVEHLERLGHETETVPAVNQVELHPYLAQRELRAYQRDHGIATEAWSPIGQGGDVLDDPAIGAIAESHDRSPAQVIIRWHLQSGNIVIPKSVTPERIAENFRAFDFELSDAEMAQVDGLDRGDRLGPDPATFVRP